VEQQLILDRYRPLEELGEGGYSTVVLAWDTRMQRRVAIKRMALPVDRFGRPLPNPPGLTEARTAALLNHPSIVTVFDFETDADEAFIIMEHADGASLERVLDDLGDTLDLDEAAAVLEAVADALTFAHDNGVLHLDIKPANVLVMHDGRIKVADFGMSALSTALGHGVSEGGTIGYMPLEQLEGLRVGEATDEWALASLLYECLTAENPFDDDTIEGAIVRIETREPPAPRSLVPSLPRAVDDVLLAALGPRPADRYPDVASFADALAPHLGDPVVGRESLADIVAAYAVDDVDDVDDLERAPGFDELGLWDRLGGRVGDVLLRIVAAAESGWLTWAGLAGTHLDRTGVLGAVVLIALAGALAPSLGTELGIAAFAVGMIASGAWVLGGVVLVLGGVWWWVFARKSAGAAVIPLSAPALGVGWCSLAAPLLAGFSLAPLSAAAAGLAAGVLSVLASAASFVSAPYASVDPGVFIDLGRAQLVAASVREAFLNPTTYIVLIGWALAAFVMSLLASRATRISAMIGAMFGAVVLGGAYALADQASVALGNGSVWVSTQLAISLAASLTMVLLVAALGAPVRPEEDDGPE
jgi:hypothetical protein